MLQSMDTSDIKDESSCEGRDISIEEFWRTEILDPNNVENDVDLIENSNQNLHYSEVNREFMKFSDYINRPLYRDNFGDLLIPTFRLLYLLLLSNNGKCEAEKFFVRFHYLFSSDFEDLLQCGKSEDAKNLLKSQPRITVKLTKRAYMSLLNWIKGNFSETSKMFNILRVLHENFQFDIQKDKEVFFENEKQLMERLQNWFSVQTEPSESSEHNGKVSPESNVQSDKTQGAEKKCEPYPNQTCEESVNNIQCDRTKKARKKSAPCPKHVDEETVNDSSSKLHSSMFVLKPSARRYLEKVRNSGLSMEEMEEALLNPPSEDEDEEEDDMMDFSDGGSVSCRMYQ